MLKNVTKAVIVSIINTMHRLLSNVDRSTLYELVVAEPKIFETYEFVDGLKPCYKKKITIKAKQIHTHFRVKSLEGDYAQGKPGDYLMKGIRGELYICAKDIFEESYVWE